MIFLMKVLKQLTNEMKILYSAGYVFNVAENNKVDFHH